MPTKLFGLNYLKMELVDFFCLLVCFDLGVTIK